MLPRDQRSVGVVLMTGLFMTISLVAAVELAVWLAFDL